MRELFSAADIERFWSKVDRSGGPDACWPWTGGTDKDGYGKFQITRDGKQRNLRANRVALILSGCEPSAVAMHSCDNPPCCNRKHLEGGTQAKNRADCASKGRAASGDRNAARLHPETHPRGESHPRAQLTRELVLEIRALHARGQGISSIARQMGLNRQPVKSVVHRKTWRHV